MRAPERDNDATAFELDASCLAPEVSRICLAGNGVSISNYEYKLCTAPQLLCHSSLPEVKNSIKKPTEQFADRHSPKSMIWWIRIIVTLVLVAAVAIGVGVGVGIWHTKRESSSTIRYDLLADLYCHLLTTSVHRLRGHQVSTHKRCAKYSLHRLSSTIHHSQP